MNYSPKTNAEGIWELTSGYQPDWSQPPVVFPDDWIVPRRYTATMNLTGLPRVVLEVEVSTADGKPRCKSLTLVAPDAVGVTSTMLRDVPVAWLLRTSLAGVAEKVEPGPDGVMREAPMTGADVEAFKRARRASERPHRQRGSGSPDDLLKDVARIYRDAARAPTKTVGEDLGYSRAHAGKLVMEARRRGFLGPAVGTRAGEGR